MQSKKNSYVTCKCHRGIYFVFVLRRKYVVTSFGTLINEFPCVFTSYDHLDETVIVDAYAFLIERASNCCNLCASNLGRDLCVSNFPGIFSGTNYTCQANWCNLCVLIFWRNLCVLTCPWGVPAKRYTCEANWCPLRVSILWCNLCVSISPGISQRKTIRARQMGATSSGMPAFFWYCASDFPLRNV